MRELKKDRSPNSPNGPREVASRPIEILLVEDNPADVRMTVEALKDCRVSNTLSVVEDGEQALSFLHKHDGYSQRPRPDLILLDLNLPRKDGHEVLAEIKADPELRKIPVVVLTTSENERDVRRAYDLNANCYITKPMDLAGFAEVIRAIEHFWFTVVSLPQR